jgi:hypothetical protein
MTAPKGKAQDGPQQPQTAEQAASEVKLQNYLHEAATDSRRAALPTAEDRAARAAAKAAEELARLAPNSRAVVEKLAAHRAAMAADKTEE